MTTPAPPPIGSYEAVASAMRWEAECRRQPPPDDAEIEAAFDLLRAEQERYGSVTQAAERNEDRKARRLAVVPEGAHEHVLDEVAGFLDRFVRFPSFGARDAVTLWVAHTHAFAAAESTPRLALLSAEKRSGKSRTLELVELLAANALATVSMSAAALYRVVEEQHPTLLLDEADTIFGKARDDRNEDLRGLLNAGHRRGARAYRCAGQKMETVKAYDAFCPVALAGIGDLPGTIADRSITVRMRRRAPGEPVERLRRRKVGPVADDLRSRLSEWSAALVEELRVAEPVIPPELDDRAADGWEPLLAIADAAGGTWPARARVAALELSAGKLAEDDTIGVRLLADCRTAFTEVDRLSSADLASRLCHVDEAPWGAWYGRPLDARALAKMLKPFDIRPRKVRFGEETAQGYAREWFVDAWGRYLPPNGVPATIEHFQPEQPEQCRSEALFDPEHVQNGQDPETPSDLRCSDVPAENPGTWTGDETGLCRRCLAQRTGLVDADGHWLCSRCRLIPPEPQASEGATTHEVQPVQAGL